MKAIRFDEYGDYDVLKQVELPKPQPANGQVLVRVKAAAVNPLDDTVRAGHFPYAMKPPLVLGNEGVGAVEGGDGTRVFLAGDYGVARNGTWQEYVTANAAELVAVPESLSHAEAAALPIGYLTAYIALTRPGGFEAGKSVLVPGGGGSVGNAAIQLARALGAKRVVTTASSPDKAHKLIEQGFLDTIDLSKEGIAHGVQRITGGEGVDIVIDAIGSDVLVASLDALKPGGVLVTLGYVAGTEARIDVRQLLGKQTRIAGFSLFSQLQAIPEAYSVILPLVESGKVRPVVARVLPLAQAAEAQRYLKEDRPFGKVILTIE